ncbi:MAG: gliding motility lipoprotein GldD [Candidatus Azobacteroides sp.]|nr:gliding motility lipoprotein GldD [Candidatus Azobacteroides sp.]
MKQGIQHGSSFIVGFILLQFAACSGYSPKPLAYFRIDIPEPEYQEVDSFHHFAFELSNQALITQAAPAKEGEFFNISYPRLNATIYCSFIPLKKDNLAQLSEESRKFVYLHTIKADDIQNQFFEYAEQNVYGLVYRIEGNVASPIQFVLTDSIRSFFRGALYFDNPPNQDSIAPVLEYINNDIQVLIESFRWKKQNKR